MDQKQAIGLATRLFARYPGTKVDEFVLAAYAEDLAPFPVEEATRLVLDYTRENPSAFAPSSPQLTAYLRRSMKRERVATALLPEPKLTEEQKQANIARGRELVAGINIGPKKLQPPPEKLDLGADWRKYSREKVAMLSKGQCPKCDGMVFLDNPSRRYKCNTCRSVFDWEGFTVETGFERGE